jgi:hypothetical protein
MAESETSRVLHNGGLTSNASDAAIGVAPPARKAVPTAMPIAPHRYTLQFLISIIKNSQQRRPSQRNE